MADVRYSSTSSLGAEALSVVICVIVMMVGEGVVVEREEDACMMRQLRTRNSGRLDPEPRTPMWIVQVHDQIMSIYTENLSRHSNAWLFVQRIQEHFSALYLYLSIEL